MKRRLNSRWRPGWGSSGPFGEVWRCWVLLESGEPSPGLDSAVEKKVTNCRFEWRDRARTAESRVQVFTRFYAIYLKLPVQSCLTARMRVRIGIYRWGISAELIQCCYKRLTNLQSNKIKDQDKPSKINNILWIYHVGRPSCVCCVASCVPCIKSSSTSCEDGTLKVTEKKRILSAIIHFKLRVSADINSRSDASIPIFSPQILKSEHLAGVERST